MESISEVEPKGRWKMKGEKFLVVKLSNARLQRVKWQVNEHQVCSGLDGGLSKSNSLEVRC